MRPDEPYVRSWVYRFLAPLAIAQVIERQVSAADFSVDASALELLIFLSRAERMLTTTDVVKDDPRVDLSRQTQHLFRDNLRAAAAKLIVVDQQGEARVTDYGTFLQRQGLETDGALQALVMIFTRCNSSLLENPVFWVRLVGYGYACTRLMESQGTSFGFESQPYSLPSLLSGLSDGTSQSRVPAYVAQIEAAGAKGL
jgi:hypothetical protein